MLAIAWEYLGGRAVATDPNDRLAAEWPPHPDRIFQALVASWAGGDESGREALRWLCSLGPPRLALPDEVTPCKVVRTFVPVNDIEAPQRGGLTERHEGLLPSRRPRKARVFPATHLGSGTCALVWSEADPSPHRGALATLCAGVTHVGHSSSLVRMWLTDTPPTDSLVPVEWQAQWMLRVPDPGRLDALVAAYAHGGEGWTRPPQSAWQGYHRVAEEGTPQGAFDDRLLVLRQVAGARLSLLQAREAARGLRALFISMADRSPSAMRLLSGHEPDGSPLAADHVAYLPLPFVSDPQSGTHHADGHLLGMAVAFPRTLEADLEQELLDVVADAMRLGEGVIRLTFGQAGAVSLVAEDRPRPPVALRPETWSHRSALWGTVTPIALDRLPPRRHADRDAWTVEQIARGCLRQGLPAPESTELTPVSPHRGALPAAAWPAMLRKDGTRRWHVHARLRFERAVRGPLLLGAGRYVGYGLCKPLAEARKP